MVSVGTSGDLRRAVHARAASSSASCSRRHRPAASAARTCFRTIFLYPFAMSFIVTGLVWQWLLNPDLGIQKMVRDLGWTSFRFDWIVQPGHGDLRARLRGRVARPGLVMAMMLAGLRGIDEDIWKAARVDGIPPWRVYLSIVIPHAGPVFVTAVVLLATGVVKLYDLVVAMTNGGPGIASEVPAKFVMDHLFERSNIGLATAAATYAAHRRCRARALALLRRSAGAGVRTHERRRRLHRPPRRPRRSGRGAAAAAHAGAHRALRLPGHRRAFFLLPLYVMVVTSLKAMDGDPLGNIFACRRRSRSSPGSRPGRRPAPGSTATASASASGTRCAILVPSVIALDRHRARSPAMRCPSGA